MNKMKLAALLSLAALLLPRASHAQDSQPPQALSFLKPNSIVEFIGDSITDGGRARTGNDYNHTMGQDYAYILAATLGNQLAERNLTFINRGISGNRVTDLQTRWQTDVLDLKPDVLSILVGVNDTLNTQGGGEPVETYAQIYDKLLADTIAALPNTKIILGEPFLLPVGKHKAPYAAELAELKKRQDAVAVLAAKYKLPLVRYQQAFDNASRRAPADHWSWDGVHPHYAGHSLMAAEWLKAAGDFWK